MSKTAYIWGPVSSFSGPLAAGLLQRGWQVHLATKAPWHFALSPLDLRSYATATIEKAFGGHERFKTFQDRLRFLDVGETARGTTYDAFIFCGMPPNFDEQRVSRAPWAAGEFEQLHKKFKDTPTFIVSSLWGAVQQDGVVPEEIDCERRKPLTHFESVSQQYEHKILKALCEEVEADKHEKSEKSEKSEKHDKSEKLEKNGKPADWYLVRLPLISGGTTDGKAVNYTGVYSMLEKLDAAASRCQLEKKKQLDFPYNPDSTFWFLPCDVAVQIFARLLDDANRPKICNLVSTQATLNREWVRDLVSVLGCSKSAPSEDNPVGFPTVLRTMLTDNILVKTRNLFEVMGRYQQTPTILDVVYFERMLGAAREENWGRPVTACQLKQDYQFSDHLVRDYFQNFLPAHADTESLKSLTANGAGLAFIVEGGPEATANTYRFILRSENGNPVTEPMTDNENGAQAGVTFSFTPTGMMKLIQRKSSLERAIVSREAKVSGRPLELLKASSFLKRFLKENPYRQDAPDTVHQAKSTNMHSHEAHTDPGAAGDEQQTKATPAASEGKTTKGSKATKSGSKKELTKSSTRSRKPQ
jgi:hypothetical protein